MKKASQLAALFGAAVMGVAATGCNTIEGFGRDLQAAGSLIAGTPKDEKKAPATATSSSSSSAAPAPAAAPPPAPQRR